jgi:hypothetical protein
MVNLFGQDRSADGGVQRPDGNDAGEQSHCHH